MALVFAILAVLIILAALDRPPGRRSTTSARSRPVPLPVRREGPTRHAAVRVWSMPGSVAPRPVGRAAAGRSPVPGYALSSTVRWWWE